jgi:hypothetical protein
MSLPVLRARTPSEILDAAFQVLRLQFTPVMLASVAFMAPAILLAALAPLESLWWVKLLVRGCAILASGATIVLVSDFYLGKPVSVGSAAKTTLRRSLLLLLIAFVQSVAIGISALLLIIPAFIVFAWTFAMPVAALVEEAGPDESWERSRELARDNIGRVLLTAGLTFLLTLLGGVGLGAGIALAAPAGGLVRLEVMAQALVKLVFYPFTAIVYTLLYFDLRIRKEAFDVELAAHRLAGTVPKMKVAFW